MGEGANKYRVVRPGRVMGRNTIESAAKRAAEEKAARREETLKRTMAKRDTDSGMTPAQAKSVKAFEDKVQKQKTERVAVIGPNGEVMAQSKKGTRNRTELYTSPFVDYSDAVLTHNHPTHEMTGTNLAGRVNNPFSANDIKTTVSINAKELRIRSGGGYIYSLRRNGDTWGVSADAIANELQRLSKKYVQENFDGRRKVAQAALNEEMRTNPRATMLALLSQQSKRKNKTYTPSQQVNNARANVAGQHRAMKELAKKYGWTYTRRKA